MIKGEFIGLRAIDPGDLWPLLRWRNNPNFRKHYREYRELTLIQQQEWFQQMLKDPHMLMFSIVDNISCEGAEILIGCGGLTYINFVFRTAEISLYIGAKDLYLDDKFAPDAWRTLMRYGFEELGMNKLWVEAYEFDEKRIALCHRFNFHQDGKLRQNAFKNGVYWDSLIFSMLRNEWIDWDPRND